jgi:mRNA-degrading endonuclease RelE of RelBE toxin-antitoxin system
VTYRIEYLESVVQDDIPRLSTTARKQVRAAIERRLGVHPVEFGKPLRYSSTGVAVSASATTAGSTPSSRRT